MDGQAWRALIDEEPIDPDRAIIDAHHHLWDAPPVPQFESYGEEAVVADQNGGHNIVASVYVEASSYYRTSGPEQLRVVGETEHINAAATRMAAHNMNGRKPCAAIIACADLLLGDAVQEVLEAHAAAAPSRFAGIRYRTPFDRHLPEFGGTPGILASASFRAGFSRLRSAGLTFDAMVFQSQLPELDDLCRRFEDTIIVLNHVGCPIGVGEYADRRSDAFNQWHRDMKLLSTNSNLRVKLGGLNMDFVGLVKPDRDLPPTSDEVVALQKDYLLETIDMFGPQRCMFESNFPVDMPNISYNVVWNAFKKIASEFSEAEKSLMFSDTCKATFGASRF
jgi:L-fuconolactonase